jgi:SCY1-like protein 1
MFAKLAGGLTALTGFGGTAFPYNVDEAYPDSWGHWVHHSGSSKEDGSLVSIFKIASEDPSDRKLIAARNGVKRLKMVRHPNILQFKESQEIVEKGATVIYLVTQPVKPLKLVLEELNLSGQHRYVHYQNFISS